MGGSIGGVFKQAVNVLKPLAQTALKAVSPQAISMLQNLAKSGFDGIKNAAQSLVSRLPGIGQLASKLLGTGFDKLQGLALDGIQKYIQQLIEKLAPRNVPGTTPGQPGSTVTTPALPDRAATATREASNVASTAAAATGSTASAATAAGKNIEDAVMNGSAFNNVPAEPVIDGTEDEKTLAKKQAQLQKYARMMQAITAFLQASHEMKKGIIQNFRV